MSSKPSFLALALAAAAVAPQTALAIPASFPADELVRDRWSTRDGLPVSGVGAVSASAGGYLWLGTDEGLVRFDGSRFTVIDREVEPGLAMPATSAIHEDPSGALWVGMDVGLAVRRGAHFEPVPLEGVERVSLNRIDDDGAGGTWAATDRGLFRVPPGARSASRDGRLGEVVVATVAGDGRGGVWAGGPWGIAHLSADGAIRRLDVAALGGGVRSVEVRGDGVLRLGGDGVFELDPGTGRVSVVTGSRGLRVNSVLTDRDGVLWVATYTGLFREGGTGLERVELVGASPFASVTEVAEDGEGSIWVATADSGLHRIRVGMAATVGTSGGLGSEMVNGVLEARDGTVWLATSGGLVALRDGALRTAHLPLAPGERVFAVDEDGQGRIWAGTDARIFRQEAGRWQEVGAGPVIEPGRIRAVVVDARGVVWAGTSRGLFRLEGDRFVVALDAEGRPVATVIAAFARTPAGDIWAGGLSGVGPIVGGRFQRIPGTTGCFGLTAGADGTVWAGQMGGGFLRIRGGRVERFGRSQGILEENVLAAVEDSRGNVWLSSNHGVQRVSLDELDAVAQGRAQAVAPLQYGTSDGMADRECNATGSPGAWRGADGRIWFPTVKGAVVFDPAREEPPPPAPRVAIEEVLVDGARVEPAGELRLPPGTRRVSIRYTGLALAAPDRLAFRHQLVGLDPEEVDAGAERTVQYAGLPPGSYRFVLRAVRERGVVSEHPAVLSFVLEPHLWQSPWFAPALSFLLLVALAAAERHRVRSTQERERELEARVAEAMARVKVLSGLLPVCAWCNKIRAGDDTWERLDTYVAARSQAKFTHVLCPSCAERMERGDVE